MNLLTNSKASGFIVYGLRRFRIIRDFRSRFTQLLLIASAPNTKISGDVFQDRAVANLRFVIRQLQSRFMGIPGYLDAVGIYDFWFKEEWFYPWTSSLTKISQSVESCAHV